MKIGVISKGSPDYLIDIVTDGLIRLFGRSNVCLDYNTTKISNGTYTHLLNGFDTPNSFDIHDAEILIASTRSIDAMRQWMKTTGKRKVAFLDGEDGEDVDGSIAAEVQLYFKREHFPGRSYPDNVKPLSFAAIPELITYPPNKWNAVFYLGNETHLIRREIGEMLDSLGYKMGKLMPKGEYNSILASSRIGVSARGCGWDTYRYWEIPYLGATLFAQRTPLSIHKNFVDGLEAVFFNDASDFKSKLVPLINDPGRTDAIAYAGRKASLERHLSIHRAATVVASIA